jgi:tRNA pseudouridine32 synthase/23S rRNA pseudouridine746 synthase
MFDIIAENQDFIIISKHANVDVHKTDTSSLINEIRKQIHNDDLHMCHRLDKKTSGLMIFAKSRSVASKIQTLFEERKIQRLYLAISDRKTTKKNGTIKGDLLKSRNGNYKLSKSMRNPSVTNFRSLSINNVRVFLIKPITGKTHQIRVAMKSISSPIVGDDRYTGTANEKMLLHAYSLNFEWKGKEQNFKNLPDYSKYLSVQDLEICINKLKNKW